MRSVVLVTLAGCYSPTVATGIACGPGDACPNGQVCVAGFCDGVAPTRDGSADSIDAPEPALGWAVPTKITEVSSAGEDFSPSLFANGLRIYLASDRTVSDEFRIWYATRTTVALAFSSPSPSAELDLTGAEYDPEVSAVGVEFHYVVTSPMDEVRRTTRANTDLPWTLPSQVTGVADREGPSLALSDLRLFVSLGNIGGIEEWQRTDPSAAWTLVRAHPSLATLAYPGISEDGLEIYASHIDDATLFRATRATIMDEFGSPVRVMFGSAIDSRPIYDPELSPDGKTMYLSIRETQSFDIFVTTRP